MLAAEANTSKILVSTPSQALADELSTVKFPHAHQFKLISRAHESPTTIHLHIEITDLSAARPIATWLCDRVKKYDAQGTKIEGRTCPDNEEEVIVLIKEIVAETNKERASSDDSGTRLDY